MSTAIHTATSLTAISSSVADGGTIKWSAVVDHLEGVTGTGFYFEPLSGNTTTLKFDGTAYHASAQTIQLTVSAKNNNSDACVNTVVISITIAAAGTPTLSTSTFATVPNATYDSANKF